MCKKILKIICIFTMILSISIPVFATEYQSYKDVDYNYSIVPEEDWKSAGIGKYPIDVYSDVWNQLSSNEAVAACNMPMKYAKSLATRELVYYAINYPFLMDILVYDNITDGMRHLKNKSSVFEELFSRPDCYDELLEVYSELDVDYVKVIEMKDMCETNYDSELFIEAYVGLNYDLLSEEQEEKFAVNYKNKFSERDRECQDSMLAKIFYAAMEEKRELISKDDGLEKNVTNCAEVAKQYDPLGLVGPTSTCEICGATTTPVNLSINGRTVSCIKWLSGGLTSVDIAQMDNYIATAHPSYIKIRSASSPYNCHSYAWYSTAITNIYWIDNLSAIYSNTSYWTEWDDSMRSLRSGDRITFWNGTGILHSAIMDNATTCTSKLGHYGVYRTTITEMEAFYEASSTKAYIPN